MNGEAGRNLATDLIVEAMAVLEGLPPIDTSSWTVEGLDEEIARVRAMYLDVLHQDS